MASVEIVSMGERPELAERLRDVGNDWPLYMLEDPVSKSRYSSAIDLYPDLQLVALQDDHAIAVATRCPSRGQGPQSCRIEDGTGRLSPPSTIRPTTAALSASSRIELTRLDAAVD